MPSRTRGESDEAADIRTGDERLAADATKRHSTNTGILGDVSAHIAQVAPHLMRQARCAPIGLSNEIRATASDFS